MLSVHIKQIMMDNYGLHFLWQLVKITLNSKDNGNGVWMKRLEKLILLKA